VFLEFLQFARTWIIASNSNDSGHHKFVHLSANSQKLLLGHRETRDPIPNSTSTLIPSHYFNQKSLAVLMRNKLTLTSVYFQERSITF